MAQNGNAALASESTAHEHVYESRKCGVAGCFQLKLHGLGVCHQHAAEIDAVFTDETKPQLTLVPPVRDTLPCPAPATKPQSLPVSRKAANDWFRPCAKCGALAIPPSYMGEHGLCRDCRKNPSDVPAPKSDRRPVAKPAPASEPETASQTVEQKPAADVTAKSVAAEDEKQIRTRLFKTWLHEGNCGLEQIGAYAVEGKLVEVGGKFFRDPAFHIRYCGKAYPMFFADRAARIKDARRALQDKIQEAAAAVRAEKEQERLAAEAKRKAAAESRQDEPRPGKSSGKQGKGGGKSSGKGGKKR